jgi:hypothetical protein
MVENYFVVRDFANKFDFNIKIRRRPGNLCLIFVGIAA